ncbi:MAG: hypothetical protein NTZ53_12825 [Cyanobacteria bacterium]|nr:hypothetical protein [Cyanobacteriota bacterium]
MAHSQFAASRIDHFGASAPGRVCIETLGFTLAKGVAKTNALLT